LKKFLVSLFHTEFCKVKEVDIIFCTDEYLLALNKNHLKHDYYTDTLSFLLSDRNDPINGEVYISIPRIRANSKRYKCTYQEELIRVIIHGCLHLCGYEDSPTSEFHKMEAIQEKYVHQWKSFT
jgi:rRNA maturation RNase YbeY